MLRYFVSTECVKTSFGNLPSRMFVITDTQVTGKVVNENPLHIVDMPFPMNAIAEYLREGAGLQEMHPEDRNEHQRMWRAVFESNKLEEMTARAEKAEEIVRASVKTRQAQLDVRGGPSSDAWAAYHAAQSLSDAALDVLIMSDQLEGQTEPAPPGYASTEGKGIRAKEGDKVPALPSDAPRRDESWCVWENYKKATSILNDLRDRLKERLPEPEVPGYASTEGKGIRAKEGDKVPALPSDAPRQGESWYHWRHGRVVQVITCGLHTETMEELVVYTDRRNTWIRPLSMWNDQARPGVQRFTRVK